jgi:hypothetical protein
MVPIDPEVASPPPELRPASQVLRRLQDTTPADGLTLAWLLDSLRERSFAIIMLALGALALAPGISTPAGLLLLIPACQMMVGLPAPVFPAWLAGRRLPNRYLAPVLRRAESALGYLERLVRPRWPVVVAAARRPVGALVALLSICAALFPVPFSNLVPAALICVIALAYLEGDGLLLVLAALGAVVAIAAVVLFVGQAVIHAGWLASLF